MRIRRLSIQGYKSFAARAEFVFDGGVTAIVGPNGSGKSNVADALRWALGEQSNLALRTRRTTDLIFAGSDGRNRVGMAEANLILDNSDNSLPIDYQEVAITRRAYRSGESEYYLNGNRVRLRDVEELLAQGGLAGLTYAVIGQGMVDAALSLSAGQRRRLFEEAAGITVYQSKREEALRRLEETGANVLRLHDVMGELEPQLKRLLVQAEQAARLATLQTELRGLQMQYYCRRLQAAAALATTGAERASYLQLRLEQQRQELAEFEAAGSRLRAREQAYSNDLESWGREGERLRGALATAERQQAVLTERRNAIAQRLSELVQAAQVLNEELADSRRETITATEAVKSLSLERQRLEAELAVWEERAAAVRRQHRDQEHQLFSLRELSAAALGHQAEAKARLEAEQRRLQETQRQLAQSEAEGERLHSLQVERAAALAKFEQDANTARQALEEATQLLTARREAMRRAQDEVTQRRREFAAVEEEMQRLRARLEMLTRVQNESYYPGVRAVLAWAKQEGANSGIIGPVSALLTVPKELEQAIEAVLGSRLQQVVVRAWKDAEAAIAYLKRSGSGRVTFLPLETIRINKPLALPPIPGVLGLGSDLLQIGPGLENVLQYLLNHTVIAKDLPSARLVLQRVSGSYSIGTLDGEVAQSSGSVTGGAEKSGRSAATLDRERERRAIPEQITALAQQQERANGRLTLAQRTLREAESALSATESATQQARTASDNRQRLLSQAKLELQQAEERWRWQGERIASLEKEITSAKQAIALAETAATEAAQTAADLSAQANALAAGLSDSRDDSEIKAEERRLSLAALRERFADANARENASKLQSERLAGRIHERQEQQASLSLEGEQVAGQLRAAESDGNEFRRALEELQASVEPARREFNLVQIQRQALDGEERARRQWHLQFSHICGEAERAASRARDVMESLRETAAHDLGEDIVAQILQADNINTEEEPLPALVARFDTVRERCRHLGAVNPNAPREHADLLERYQFLATQAEDLEKAAASLRRVIAELEQTMQKRFGDTFTAVAKNFSTNFNELFGGGSAHLQLTAPDDLNNSGVEITVRPPGKHSQDLSLLSGGERALTSCALLFALLQVSQTPFCLLDEVDAMLDEANVGRFRRVMQNLAERTQFIVISHNRATVQAASIIYGVTMGEDGTSRVLSLRLDEASKELARG